MRHLLLLFAACGLSAQTEMREIPDSLKNPAQLKWPAGVIQRKALEQHGWKLIEPQGMPEAAAPEQGCSIRLLEVPIPEGSKITVIRPEFESRMPLLKGPLPACETVKR